MRGVEADDRRAQTQARLAEIPDEVLAECARGARADAAATSDWLLRRVHLGLAERAEELLRHRGHHA